MSIKTKRYKRKDGSVSTRQVAVIQLPAGKQMTKSFERKVDAERWERQQRALLDAGQTVLPKHEAPTVAELATRWLEEHSKVRKAASSHARDQQLVKHQIVPTLGGIKVSVLAPAHVERWVSQLAETLAPKTTNDALGLLKKMLSDAVRWRVVLSNPIECVQRVKREQQDYLFWTELEAKQVLQFLRDAEPTKYPWFVLALNTGMRSGELRALTWECVDLDGKLITVRQSYCHKSKRTKGTKSGRIRYVPINPTLLGVLVEMRKGAPEADPVLRGFRMCNSSKLMRRIAKEAGVRPIRWHDLRHTFASHYMLRGGLLFDLQAILGHSTPQMTQRYAHHSREHLRGKTDLLGFGVAERPLAGVVNLLDRRSPGPNLDHGGGSAP